MALKIVSPREASHDNGIKILVHGPAGAGKTVLATTAGEPTLIISAEAGLLSIQDAPDYVKVTEVKSVDDVRHVYSYLSEGTDFRWVVLDSISEIGEVVLATEKANTKDPRQAYGALIDEMGALIRAFRDLPGYNVVFTAKQERAKDEATGMMLYGPAMPGAKLGPAMSYWFDCVFAYRVERDPEGNPERWLQTARDLQHEAKDRSGRLDPFERPNLAHIAAKIRGTQLADAA